MTTKHITNKISNYFHKFATYKFPKIIQNSINYIYVSIFDIDMSEFKKYDEYQTLNELFTRALQKPRDFDKNTNTFISPTDSFITQAGKIKKQTALQIKGMSYDIKNLLTSNIEDKNLQKIIDGDFMNFYLSPKDYHRYHSPIDMKIVKLIHIPGKLYPVNFKYLNKQENLFIENERVILECLTKENKLFYMVFVGALNVGKMVFNFEKDVTTNTDVTKIKVYDYENLEVKKGECLGYFMMGSTVLMFWEKDTITLQNLINKKVKFTKTIAKTK
jgi:phosphatidylserine decarboxylase